MANPIQIKRSSTASAVPAAGSLLVGELAVNLADKKLYTKDGGGTVILLARPTPGTSAQLLASDGSGGYAAVTVGSGLSLSGGTLAATAGGGSVTSVSVVTANGISGTVANASTTPAITLSLGAINPTSIGATTPSTGAFTTLTASTSVGYQNGATSYLIGSTGYNGPVGATTGNTGAFTTLSATGRADFIKSVGTPANYYNGLQAEFRAGDNTGTVGLSFHRPGYSHAAIYHDASGSLKFNIQDVVVTLNNSTGTILGTGNGGLYENTWINNKYFGSDGTVRSNVSVRAPIFYDSDDTAYYIDPANGGTWAGYFNGYVSTHYFNQRSGNSENPPISQFMVTNGSDNFFRKASATHVNSQLETVNKLGNTYYQVNTWLQLNGGYGIYSPSINGAHFYPNNATSYGTWYVAGSRNSWNGISFAGDGNGHITLMARSNYSGIYNDTYGWQIYWADGALYSSYSSYGGSYTRVLQEDRWIGNKHFSSGGAIYGTIFYDTNNTNYYCDPDNSSILWNVNVNGTLNVGSATNSYINMVDSDEGNRSIHCNSNRIGFLNQSGGWGAWCDDSGSWGVTGDIYASGNISAYFSDERLKTRLGRIENALAKLKTLTGFYFEPNATAQALGYEVKRQVGVSAQEVQAILPEIIAPAPIDPQYMTLDYAKLVPLLIEAIKEQQEQIEKLTRLVPTH